MEVSIALANRLWHRPGRGRQTLEMMKPREDELDPDQAKDQADERLEIEPVAQTKLTQWIN